MLCFVLLLPLVLPGLIPTAEGSLTGRSAFSSSYRTRTWLDSLQIQAKTLLGLTWSLSQRLDLLRKQLSTGRDLRQRQFHALLTAQSPRRSPVGWKIDLDGDESSITESVDRRTLWSRFLVGGGWYPGKQAYVEAQVGGIASAHRAGAGRTDDQGLAQHLGLEWSGAGLLPAGGYLRSSLTHEGDGRVRIPAQDTRLAIGTDWAGPTDSVTTEWAEQWSNVRFFPSPDRFDVIGRQQRRNRSAQVQWRHSPAGRRPGFDHDRGLTVGWNLDATYGLNQNLYDAALLPGQTMAFIPGDTRTVRRAYGAGTDARGGPWAFSLEYHYRWTEDRFGEVRRDQTGETGELNSTMSARVTSTDSTGVRAIFRVTSYAVPADSGFFDDRDEAERVIEAFWWHRFSPELALRPVLSFQRQRQIFLSERRSADNNTNDIYVLAPAVIWNLTRAVMLQQTFALRAHYRSFDFERKDPLGRSTLFRRAESVSDVRIAQVSAMTWTVRYTYRYEDFGGLYDRGGWVQAVDWDRRSNLIDFRLHWRPGLGLSFEPEVALEFKRSFNHRREADRIRRIQDNPFWRRQLVLQAVWVSRYGYCVRLSLAQRTQDLGLGRRDLDNRWEFSLSKGVM